MKLTLITEGMHCKSCEMLVCDTIEDELGVSKVSADFKTGKILLESDKDIDLSAVKKIIANEGYKIKDIQKSG